MSKITHDIYEDPSIDYDVRHLDALSNIFHFQSVCSSCISYKNKIFLSYNSSATPSSSKKLNILSIVITNKIVYSSDDAFAVCLYFNSGFREFINKIRSHLSPEDKTSLERFKSILQAKEMEILKSPDPLKLKDNIASEKLIEDYKLLAEKLKNYPDFIERFIRPYQDVKKLCKYLADSNKELNIELLPNDANIHAEYNISQKFPLAELLEINYIGVSKLCCGYCHEYLNKMGFKHRGTHGTCDDGWNMAYPYQLEDFKESIKLIEEFAPRNQERLLSTDEEFELSIDEGAFFLIKSQFIRAAGGGRGGGGAAAPEEPAIITSAPPTVVFSEDPGAAAGGGAVLGDSSS